MSLHSIWFERVRANWKEPRKTVHIYVRGIHEDEHTRHSFLAQFLSTSPLQLCHVRMNDLHSVDLLLVPSAWCCTDCHHRHIIIEHSKPRLMVPR